MAQLLLAANATVTMCHSRTRDLAAVCARADLLIAAVGRPKMVTADWVKPGATVIDVGVNRLEGGWSATSTSTRCANAPARSRPCGRGGTDDDRLSAAKHGARRAGGGGEIALG